MLIRPLLAIMLALAMTTAMNSTAQAQAPDNWALRLPPQQTVAFRGVVNFDNAGNGGANTAYMMPGVVGFAAALAAHSLVINANLETQKTQILLEADQVLLPYRAVIDGWPQSELMEQALARAAAGRTRKLIAYLDQDEAGWIVESTPLFAMTQDQSALLLDNAIVVHAPGTMRQAAYRNTVRVVSRNSLHADLPAYWNDAQGRQLKDVSAALLALSLDIALTQAGAASRPPQAMAAVFKTVRYQQGAQVLVERAQVLAEQCGRVLLGNLRGALMSVPLSQPARDGDPACSQTP